MSENPDPPVPQAPINPGQPTPSGPLKTPPPVPAADVATCALCGQPMPEGEQMFKYHGYSGPCPKVPVPAEQPAE